MAAAAHAFGQRNAVITALRAQAETPPSLPTYHISAKGELLFIAEAGAEASVKMVLKRKT